MKSAFTLSKKEIRQIKKLIEKGNYKKEKIFKDTKQKIADAYTPPEKCPECGGTKFQGKRIEDPRTVHILDMGEQTRLNQGLDKPCLVFYCISCGHRVKETELPF